MELTEKNIRSSLENVIDPETLTTPGCPLAGMLAGSAEQAVREAFPDTDVEVSLVWDPPWTPDMLSSDAKEQLGYTR